MGTPVADVEQSSSLRVQVSPAATPGRTQSWKPALKAVDAKKAYGTDR
jgi:hypothetical protein